MGPGVGLWISPLSPRDPSGTSGTAWAIPHSLCSFPTPLAPGVCPGRGLISLLAAFRLIPSLTASLDWRKCAFCHMLSFLYQWLWGKLDIKTSMLFCWHKKVIFFHSEISFSSQQALRFQSFSKVWRKVSTEWWLLSSSQHLLFLQRHIGVIIREPWGDLLIMIY